MQLELEGMPAIDQNSWVGRAIKLTGAKTWCSLLVRGAGMIVPVSLYFFGLSFLMSGADLSDSPPLGIFQLLTTVGFVMVSIAICIGLIVLAVGAIQKFNCWAQDKCTPIFKDDND
jgi:hypothetical protein